ncbi:MAG TPA: VCBS repeat-containing protein [Gemmatimonadales bacterium]|nr:VCBS repeat-containing protein [Gemmatimonadales bacterium]
MLAAAFLVAPACVLAQSGGYTRQVTAFPVVDIEGREYPMPFLGGFDLPRPQLVDIDGDGDLDLFVQEVRDDLKFFERRGGQWIWRTDRWQDVTAGEWFRFADLDGDGDMDLLTEQPMGYVRAWQNEGTKTSPRMAAAPDSLRDITGTPIFADPQNILNVVDIDCNGRLDLFLGRVAGHVDRYEEEGRDPSGLPIFRLLAERWQDIEVLGPIPGDTAAFTGRPTMRHGANTLAFGDIDADGDLDLFWGDFFEAGLLLIRNEGTCASPDLRGAHEQFPLGNRIITTGYNAPATGDIDGDGLLDLVMGVIGGAYQPNHSAVDNLFHIRQVAPDSFEVVTRRMIGMIDVGAESVPALADIDGDGDLDLLIGNKIAPDDATTGTLTWFENVGSSKAPSLAERGLLEVRGEFHWAPAVVDLDGDGLADLVLGTWRDRVQWWRNTGSRSAPRWELADSALVTLTRGSNTVPTLGDLDGDGDLDLLVGEASGQLNFYRNVGTATAPRFELVSDEFQGIDVGRRSAPALADLDHDGTLDLLIGSEEGVISLWRGVRDPGGIRFVADQSALLEVRGSLVAPAVGDLDGDGAVDLMIGGTGGGVRYFKGIHR